MKLEIANLKMPAALRCESAAGPVLRARDFGTALAGMGTLERGVLMYMPGGTHTITPICDQGTCEATVTVNPQTASILNASLARVNAEMAPRRCFIDKFHEGNEATAWPESFFWSETGPDGSKAPGVYCRCEFSALGKQLIQGKVIRGFSPSFYTDADLPKKVRAGQNILIPSGKKGSAQNPAQIIGVAAPDVGTLTNRPAFHEILPLFASESPNGERRGSEGEKTPPGASQTKRGAILAPRSGPDGAINTMRLTTEQLNALQARKAQLEGEIPTLKAQDLSVVENANKATLAESEYNAVCSKLQAHEVAEENATIKATLLQQRTKDAKAAIKAAQGRGALPSRGVGAADLVERWEKDLIEDPDKFLPRLEATPGAPALQTPLQAQNNSRVVLSDARELRASTASVLRRYAELAAAGQSEEVATLYAMEIRKRYKEGDDMPLRAADVTDANLGTLAGTLVTQRTLEFFRLQFDGLLNMIATDFSEQPAQFKQTTNTRVVVAPAIVSYDPTIQADGLPKGYVQTTQPQTVDVPITLDQHKAVPVSIGVELLASTVRRLFDEQAAPAAYVLVKDLIDTLFTRITPAAFNSFVGNAELGGSAARGVIVADEASFSKRTIGIAGRLFNPIGVPMTDRFVLLNTDYHDDLENDPTIIRLATYQANQTNIITDGLLPRIKRFQPVEAPNLPVANNLVGFAGHKSSLVVQSRVPNDYTAVLPAGATHGLVQTVIEPDSRLTAMIVWFADHLRATGNFRIAWMYGTGVGNKKGGVCICNQ